jgi:hypothetical protein
MKTYQFAEPIAIAHRTIQSQSNCLSQEDSEPLLYVSLFHGRNYPNEILQGLGEEGPTFGPYRFVHTTYATTIKLGRPDGRVDELSWDKDDFIYCDGVYYGDYSVSGVPSSKPRGSAKYPQTGICDT